MITERKQDKSPTNLFTRLDSQKEISDPKIPQFKIVAGPNGAGKSTFAEALVNIPYINGDEIKRLSKEKGIRLDSFSLRIHIKELVNGYLGKRQSFALESNLVSNYSYDIVTDVSQKGYHTELIYVGVESEKILNDRINERVKLGKHYVSPHDVSERYRESLSKLPVNLKLFDKAVLIDNSGKEYPREVLHLNKGVIVAKIEPIPDWLNRILPTIERLSAAYEKVQNRGDKRFDAGFGFGL